MAKDHYVAQTFLDAFTENDILQIYYKNIPNKVVIREKNPRQVCYEDGWDKIEELDQPDIMKNFLNLVEPKWKQSLLKIFIHPEDVDARAVISQYLAYLRCCNPVMVEVFKHQKEAIINDIFISKYKNNLFGEVPDEAKRLIEAGKVKMEVDFNDTRFCTWKALPYLADNLMSSDWILVENKSNLQFITSDYPFVRWQTVKRIGATPLWWCALSPNRGVIVKPNLHRKPLDIIKEYLNEAGYSEIKHVDYSFVSKMNNLMIESARNLVVSSKKDWWIKQAVHNKLKYRVVAKLRKIPSSTGYMYVFSDEITKLK